MAARPKDAAVAEKLLRYARPNDSEAEIEQRLKTRKPFMLDIAYHFQGHPQEELMPSGQSPARLPSHSLS